MFGTLDVWRALVRANPTAEVTEDHVRRVLRKGLVRPSGRVAGRLIWSLDDIDAVARHLNLASPNVTADTAVAS